jgi:7-cyano-7-deazaguanine synthase
MDFVNRMTNCALPEVTVLVSGGVDSLACLGFYLAQGVRVKAMHFDYGQNARVQELEAAQKVADYYKVGLHYKRLSNARTKDAGEIFGRNAFLLFAALLELDSSSGLIAIGVHAGTRYFDCGEEFIVSIQRLFDGYCAGKIKVAAPFLKWTKPEIWEFCLRSQVPIHLTHSCERGEDKPCGRCLSCLDVEALHAR